MEELETAQKMYDYCIKNHFGQGFNEKWGLKHFSLIENNLMKDEKILMPFIGLHNYISMSKHDGYFAYAITNKRILMAQKKIIGEVFQAISLDNVNDITMEKKLMMGTITIDTIKETFNVAINTTEITSINTEIHNVLDNLQKTETVKNESSSLDSNLEKIKQLKELLDIGAITQEEFDTKKKELLNI